MDIITKTQRYLPHTLETRYYAVKLYQGGHTVSFVCRRYKISKVSLMRWNKRFNGTKESLADLSHRPHTRHPGSHTDEEIQHIRNYIRRNPRITMLELYGKLKLDTDKTENAETQRKSRTKPQKRQRKILQQNEFL